MKENDEKVEKIDKKGSHYWLPHRIWGKDLIHKIDFSHKKPKTIGDSVAHYVIQTMRIGFDIMSGYKRILPW